MKSINLIVLIFIYCSYYEEVKGESIPLPLPSPLSLSLKALAPQGIVVPKRSALISGLNQQFKSKQQQLSGINNKTSTQQNQQNNEFNQLNNPSSALNQQPEKLQEQQQVNSISHHNHNKPAIGIFSGVHVPIKNLPNWLGARVHGNTPKRLLSPPQPASLNNQNQNQQQSLYLDRHQQEILAANPNLLNPPSNSLGQSSPLFTRSDVSSAPINVHDGLNSNLQNQQSSQSSQNLQNSNYDNNQKLYKGFSLIELEVRTDSDKRYVQDLYGNLTAAINEQAQNPNVASVSPYVDVDFWSFKSAVNDQIDIMVSPKSRAFILGQLNKAKIRHRIKIDDIQSRLDTQLAAGADKDSINGNTGTGTGTGSLSMSGKSSSDGQNQNQFQNLSGRQSNQVQQELNSRQGGSGTTTNDNLPNQQNRKPAMNDSVFFENYQRLADINQYLESILEKNRDVAQVKVIGKSSQGRYLRVMKLGYDQTEVDGSTSLRGVGEQFLLNSQQSLLNQQSYNNKSNLMNQNNNTALYIMENFFRKQEQVQKVGSIWLDGGTHAREWISPATTLYIAFRLSDNHNRCRKFFDNLRIVVGQSIQSDNSNTDNLRKAKRYYGTQPNSLDTGDDLLLPAINEINNSLLGSKLKPTRPRTELEHKLELLNKSPQEVASEFGCDLEIEQLLRRYTFYIMPVLNPDGYEYSHTNNRLWRKTRSTSNHPIYRHFCLGADPNRNYDARHGSTGSSTHPCSQTYAGTVPFTEPETRHQSNFVYSNRQNMKMFISFHSYSQMILLPYSHSTQLPPDHKDLDLVGQAAVKAIERTHGTVYRVGPSASILYTASGTASDWAYEKAGIKYSYTIELRDTGTYGFLLPKQQIIPTGEETFNGLLAMIGQMEKNERVHMTSKSSILGIGTNNNNLNLNNSTGRIDLNHVPDLENLNAQTRFKNQRPLFENILDNNGDSLHGLQAWPTDNIKSDQNLNLNQPALQGPIQGVRDRRPASELASDDLRDATTTNYHTDSGLSQNEAEFSDGSYGLDGHNRLSEETIHDNDYEPDSGYAFEGEGELMEPTRENILEATKLNDARLLLGRQDHSRRIVQSAGLTSTGRNLINSPLLSNSYNIFDYKAPKRESSDDLIKEKKNYN